MTGMDIRSSRAGRLVQQPAGCRAFIPAPLPPAPAIQLGPDILVQLSHADQALGRLDGQTQTLPNPELFVAMYVRREAVLSSQIEGTQSSLEDILDYELDQTGRDLPPDVDEVVNYVRAMNHGLERLSALPLSLRLIREIHRELLAGVRGAERSPGEFRATQNWIGPRGAPLAKAGYVPPPVEEMHPALAAFERFLHRERQLPVLIHCALAHAQFETIHPFLDGNGRVGRLLITFLLCFRGVLHRPMLYLSHYLLRNRSEYYDRLMAIREQGDWEAWIKFFLRAVGETAEEATSTSNAIVELRERHRSLVQEHGLGSNGLRMLDLLFQRPLINVKLIANAMDVTFATANKLVREFEQMRLLEETTGGERNRRFRYAPYLSLFPSE